MSQIILNKDKYVIVKDNDNKIELIVHDGVIDTAFLLRDNDFIKLRSLITHVHLPESITSINSNSFEDFFNLKEINIPSKVTKINSQTFKDASSLEKVYGMNNVTEIAYQAFMGCLALKNLDLSSTKVKNIDCQAFTESGIKNIVLPKTLESIGNRAFYACKNIEKIELPDSVKNVEMYAFADCKKFNAVTFLSATKKPTIKSLFLANQFYLMINEDGKKTISTNPISIRDSKFYSYYSLENISEFDIGQLMASNNIVEDLNVYEKINQKLLSGKIDIPFRFLSKFKKEELKDFANNSNLKFFKRVSVFKEIIEKLGDYNATNFFAFANAIGAFSNDEKLAQRACVWLTDVLEKGKLDIYDIKNDFSNMENLGESQEFANFLFPLNHGEKTNNFDEIMQNYGAKFLVKVYNEFMTKENSEGNIVRDENGNLKFKVFIDSIKANGSKVSRVRMHKPTIELFADLFADKKYHSIREGNFGIAKELSKWRGMSQDHFNIAQDLMDMYKENALPRTIIKSSVMQGSQTGNYCWQLLDKDDPKNFTLGLYCDCCANIRDTGHAIMALNFNNSNVQNLVIKNKNNLIVAKATLYINAEEGYGLYNTVEIANRINNDERVNVYKEFIAATKSIVEAYNAENTKQITKMLVGNCALNDLGVLLKDNHKLTEPVKGLPTEYNNTFTSFGGTMKQFVLWENEEAVLE